MGQNIPGLKRGQGDKSSGQLHSSMRSRIVHDLLIAQAGRCAICKSILTGYREPFLDHDHEAGNVRGLLCGPCNIALGHLEARARVMGKNIGEVTALFRWHQLRAHFHETAELWKGGPAAFELGGIDRSGWFITKANGTRQALGAEIVITGDHRRLLEKLRLRT